MNFVLSVGIALFVAIEAGAYVPSLKMILKRTAENHGTGVYLIDQEVTLIEATGQPTVIHEQWLVGGGRELRLRARSKKGAGDTIDLTYVYDLERRYNLDSRGQRISRIIPAKFNETYFLFRSADFVETQAKRLGMLNSQPRPPKTDSKKDSSNLKLVKTDYFNPHVRLGRSGGSVNYVIGGLSGTNKIPGLWIEQDSFLLRKIRLTDDLEVHASDYQRHQGNLWFPSYREVHWGQRKAILKVTKIESYGNSANLKKRLSPQSLNAKEEPHLLMPEMEASIVSDFYDQLR